jgi:hypothetical protein
MSLSVSSPNNEDIVKEGWIFKKGEYIKTWRRRYFVLRKDGTLLGYKSQPIDGSNEPCNNFTIRSCQIMSLDQNRMYIFIIRGLQFTTVIERMFYAETEVERSEWIDAVRYVFVSIPLLQIHTPAFTIFMTSHIFTQILLTYNVTMRLKYFYLRFFLSIFVFTL